METKKTRKARPSGLVYKKNEPKNNGKVSFRVSDKDLEKLKRYAELKGITQSKAVREIMSLALKMLPLD